MFSDKNLCHWIGLFTMLFWAFAAHGQEVSWEEHSRAGKEALAEGNYSLAKQHTLAAIAAAKLLSPEDPRVGGRPHLSAPV
jgi:hypothetical protein